MKPYYEQVRLTLDVTPAMHALDALINIPHLAARYLGKVKLVYIDPP